MHERFVIVCNPQRQSRLQKYYHVMISVDRRSYSYCRETHCIQVRCKLAAAAILFVHLFVTLVHCVKTVWSSRNISAKSEFLRHFYWLPSVLSTSLHRSTACQQIVNRTFKRKCARMLQTVLAETLLMNDPCTVQGSFINKVSASTVCFLLNVLFTICWQHSTM